MAAHGKARSCPAPQISNTIRPDRGNVHVVQRPCSSSLHRLRIKMSQLVRQCGLPQFPSRGSSMLSRTALAAAGLVALTAAASAKPVTLSTETNLRAAPGTKSDVVTAMPKGAAIEVGECDAGWCKITYDGKEGFAIERNL